MLSLFMVFVATLAVLLAPPALYAHDPGASAGAPAGLHGPIDPGVFAHAGDLPAPREPSAQDAPQARGEVSQFAAYRSTLLWRAGVGGARWDPNGARLEIPVCWIAPKRRHSAGRVATRVAVRETWEAAAQVRFVGWGTCTEGAEGIRIITQDGVPWSYVGIAGLGKAQTMSLNFDFHDWGRACGDTPDAHYLRDDCIHSIAVHEFGHALGLIHAHDLLSAEAQQANMSSEKLNSLIANCRERNLPVASNKVVKLPSDTEIPFAYDPWSVMNYCWNIYRQSIALSNTDIRTVARMYP